MKKLLSFFLLPLKVLKKATLAMSGFIMTTPIKVAKARPPIVLLKAMLLMYELVPYRSGA
jgi:hypothetical protein